MPTSAARVLVPLSPLADKIFNEIRLDIKSEFGKHNDPWRKREAWRYSHAFSPAVGRRLLFGGCGYGIGAFLFYCAVEPLIKG